MNHEVRKFADAVEVAAAAADFVADVAMSAVTTAGGFTVAFSGGTTPQRMFAELDSRVVPWATSVIYQVDERVTTIDDPRRNLSELRNGLKGWNPTIEAMAVDVDDLDGAARRYGAKLPARLDLVHLGLGPDGHTASLIPGDPVLDVTDELVALTNPYRGLRRMTLTYPALARAEQVLWLVTGGEKREALAKLLAGDTTIPAGRVEAGKSVIMADRAALS